MKENKLIIGVSILFCTVILIIGVSFAYFTQSDTEEIGEIVSEDQVTLEYNDDNNNYMLGDLIPINETDVEKAYNNKCKDSKNYNVCSIYRFTISNTSDVIQKLVIKMLPTLNSFHNLKYNIYEINNEVSNNIKKNQELKYDDKTPITLFDNLKLNNRSSKTYEIVYYILNNPNANQNEQDAGKNFGAQITVNSITTGEYKSKEIGESCYKVMELSDEASANASPDTKYYSETISQEYYGTHILTEFYGIDEENKAPVEGCGVTKEGEFYSVTVPSKIGDKEISTLGNKLFMGFDFENFIGLEKSKIKYIEVEDGIEVIEDGTDEYTTFMFAGLYIDSDSEGSIYGDVILEYDFDFTIKLPNTLIIIGANSFSYNNIKEILIPKSVTTIREGAFGGDAAARGLSKVTFEGAEDDKSKLLTIGEHAFNNCNLTYTDLTKPLIIPSSVTTIGSGAFNSYVDSTDLDPQNRYLNYIKFNGTLTAGNTDWYRLETNGGATKEILR